MTPWSNRRVVVVEDEPGLRDLVKDVLSGRGAEVLALSTLAEAEAELARQQPDLLILDVKLPDGDGLNLLERLRDDGVRVPAVVMTAFGTVDRAVQALRAGAADFMEKPFDNERLVAAVAKALQTSQQLDEVAMRAPVDVFPMVFQAPPTAPPDTRPAIKQKRGRCAGVR